MISIINDTASTKFEAFKNRGEGTSKPNEEREDEAHLRIN